MKALVLATVALFALVAMAQFEPPTDAASASNKISPSLAQALTKSQSVRVIVSLATAPVANNRALRSANVWALRGDIASRQDRVLRTTSSKDFRLEHRYLTVPAVTGTATTAGVRDLANQSDVVQISLDLEVHSDLAQAVPLIRADDVHSQLGITGDGVIVAVLDTGIDTDHPLLVDDLNYQKCYLVSGTCPGGGTSGPSAEDGVGHGTHVSGIITSGGPPVGVAPDALIDAFKILDDTGNGSFSDVLAAYDEIISSHPDVDLINMSLGTQAGYRRGTCETLIPAMTDAVATTRSMGITTFAAAGNNGSKARISYPACLNDVVSVGATYDEDVGAASWGFCSDSSTAADQVTCFSQSDISLDLLAPGATIDSTWPGGGLANDSGTSMASPMAAGVAALLLESEPGLTPAQVEARLKGTGVPLVDVANGVTTCRVDAFEAVVNDGGSTCSSSGPPPPTNDDFAGAIEVPAPLPYNDSHLTFSASVQPTEATSCGNMGATVWYRYTPNDDELLLASTNGSNFVAALAVYTGPNLSSLTPVACDDGSDQLPSRLLFEAQGATTYYFQLGGASGDFGNLMFHLSQAKPFSCTAQPSPAMCLTMKNDVGESGLLGCDDISEPTACTAAIGAPFAVTVQASGIPSSGYVGFQTEIFLGGLVWKPRSTCGDEIVWPDSANCFFEAEAGGQLVHFALTSFFFPAPVSVFQGGLVQVDVTCPAAGAHKVSLTAWPSSLNGAAYYGETFDTVPVQVAGQQSFDTDGDTVPDSVLDIADAVTIDCVEPPTPTATSTPTPTATPTPAPTPCPDMDGDTVCDGVDSDTDGDGCPNVNEQQTAVGSETSGGRRDYFNPYDYFNPTNDGTIRVDDILAIVGRYFASGNPAGPLNTIPPAPPAYHPKFDRAPLGPNVWNLTQGNGMITIPDILAVIAQYFHDCGTGIVKVP